MLSSYSAEASLMLSNSPILKGEDLRAAIKALAADPNFSMQFRTDKLEVAKSGDVGYTRGAYTLTMSDPKTKRALTERGKYVTIYVKQADGSWKIIEDISNADGPAVPPRRGSFLIAAKGLVIQFVHSFGLARLELGPSLLGGLLGIHPRTEFRFLQKIAPAFVTVV